jgi:CheY-like chemotaxis protein
MDVRRHVLVVEKQSEVRRVLCELLVDLGFRVDVAADAPAMRAWVTGDDPFDVIVLDASLVADEEGEPVDWARRHDLRVVMVSGHPTKMKEFEDRADQLLHKPVRRADLERAIHLALASDVRGQRSEDPD